MAHRPDNSDRPSRWQLLRRFEQSVAVTILAAAIVVIGLYWAGRFLTRDRLIEIDQAPPLKAEFTVDLNSASWPEISVLPEIGETTARAIVAERERDGHFTDLEDLARRVHGIGPRVLQTIAPFVVPKPGAGNAP